MAVFDMIGRRPQRLIAVLIVFLLFLSLSTYITVSPSGYQGMRQQISSLPRPWRTGSGGGSSGLLGGAGSADTYEKSLADMYTHNPGKPQTPDDLLKWATKGADGNLYPPTFVPQMANQAPRARAAFVVLVRNGELPSMRDSMREVEDRFNRKYGYPWVFLNNEPFTEEFKKGVKQMTRSETRFGLVPKEHWSYPDWIDQSKAAETRRRMKEQEILYGDSESYRHMCRFQSGFFWQHPLTQDLDYYWRVEPGIKLYCDIDYDPFLFMQMNNKTYGFTMSLHEYDKTIPTLYETTKNFIKENPQYLSKEAGLYFLTKDKKNLDNLGHPEAFKDLDDLLGHYSLCHFWSNFEIGDFRLWRSEAYTKYFNYLDKQGGFFYERWGDAPVHSLAALLFQDRSKVHHFEDIGYFHVPWYHCPQGKAYHEGRCNCDPKKAFTNEGYSCMNYYWEQKDTKHATEPSYAVP